MYDPKEAIGKNPMTLLQYATILVCFAMNMIDGMDVLIISYAAPAISRDWAVSPEALGVVFGAGMLGMTLGTFFIAPLADRIGRKSIILCSGLIIGLCIFLTAYAGTVSELLAYRFLSGLGIGSMLAGTTALTAEYTPKKTRDFWVSLVLSGYPVGAILSGIVAAEVIPQEGWRQMFRLAGIASMFSLPLAYFFLSESVDYYLIVQPREALVKTNRVLSKMKLPAMQVLPIKEKAAKIPVTQLFTPGYRRPTLQLWLALFMAFAGMYFLLNWIPKLASDAGLSMDLAIYAGAVFNLGAFIGILTQGYFSSRFGLKRTISVIFIASAILMACFGLFLGSDFLLLILGLLGFGIQGGFVGLYATSARMYPARFRTTGVGWAMGAGRFGGIAGPLLAGVFIGLGFGIATNFILFAIPILLAGVIAARISSKEIS